MILTTQNEGAALTPSINNEKSGLLVVIIAPCRLGGKNTFPSDEPVAVDRQTRDTLVMQKQAVDFKVTADEEQPAEDQEPGKNTKKRGKNK